MTFVDHLNWPKIGQNWSGAKIVELQQSQALIPHFENFCSIVSGVKWIFANLYE